MTGESGHRRGSDDRGEPVIQLSPPLIAGPDEFDEMARIIRVALLEAMDAMAAAGIAGGRS